MNPVNTAYHHHAARTACATGPGNHQAHAQRAKDEPRSVEQGEYVESGRQAGRLAKRAKAVHPVSVEALRGRSELGSATAGWITAGCWATGTTRSTTTPRFKPSWPRAAIEVVGRVAAIINPAHNERADEKRGFFGFFESHRRSGGGQRAVRCGARLALRPGHDLACAGRRILRSTTSAACWSKATIRPPRS